MSPTDPIHWGNQQTFNEWYDAYHRRIYFFSLKSTGDVTEAEDLTQTIFLKIWENRNLLSHDIPLESQLFKIARGVVIDHYRSKTAQQRFLFTFNQNQSTATEENTDPDISVNKIESIKKAIEELPSKRREVFKLSRYHGLSYEEIADELSISKNTVHVHISKALSALRKKLANWLFF
ncbi:MAG: RNA polymerase sigma-70 factor [Saprospiraceae bacterium]|nr:RNA polymerase sigma-70 factor [Lewinella sp.]